MRNLKKLLFIIILIICLVLLTGCSENKSEEELMQEKILSELNFIENSTISILEKYLEGDYNVDGQISWQNISNDFKEIANSSSVIILDLTSKQIEYEKIMEIETRINDVNLAIENNLEPSFLEALKNLYSLIPDYLSIIYSEDNFIVLEKRVKEYLMESLYYSMIDDYSSSLLYLEEAEKIYGNLMNNTDFLNENSYKTNRVYISIQEMKLAIQNQQKESVVLKYINTN